MPARRRSSPRSMQLFKRVIDSRVTIDTVGGDSVHYGHVHTGGKMCEENNPKLVLELCNCE